MYFLAPLILAALKGNFPELKQEIGRELLPWVLGYGLFTSKTETPQFGIGMRSPEAISMVVTPEEKSGNDVPFNTRINICR